MTDDEVRDANEAGFEPWECPDCLSMINSVVDTCPVCAPLFDNDRLEDLEEFIRTTDDDDYPDMFKDA